jgi:Periviscerokinin family
MISTQVISGPYIYPVDAEHVRADEYALHGPIPEGEVWQFQPGDVVRCRAWTFSDGSSGLVAFARVQRDA